jgi:hypothetical protein
MRGHLAMEISVHSNVVLYIQKAKSSFASSSIFPREYLVVIRGLIVCLFIFYLFFHPSGSHENYYIRLASEKSKDLITALILSSFGSSSSFHP